MLNSIQCQQAILYFNIFLLHFTFAEQWIIESGRTEPTKVEFESISFVAKRPTEFDEIISGGRDEGECWTE